MRKFIAIFILFFAGFINADELRCDSKEVVIEFAPSMLSDEDKYTLKVEEAVGGGEIGEDFYYVIFHEGYLNIMLTLKPNILMIAYSNFNLIESTQSYILCSATQEITDTDFEVDKTRDFTFKVFRDLNGFLQIEIN